MMRDDISVPTYLLWSNKHKAWWRPNARGYTEDIAEAGLYTKERAIGHVIQSSYHGDPDKATCMVVAPVFPSTGTLPPASERVASARDTGYLLGRLDAARAIGKKLKQMQDDDMPAVPTKAYAVAVSLALGVDPETGAWDQLDEFSNQHRVNKEIDAAKEISDFYSERPAPLPDGVVPAPLT